MKELKAGTIIKLTRDQKKAIAPMLERCEASSQAYKSACLWKVKTNTALWDSLGQMFPEILGFECSYSKEGEICIESKMSEALRKLVDSNRKKRKHDNPDI